MNSSTAENFMRSAKAPTISAQVMAGEGGLEGDEQSARDVHALAEGGRHRVDRDALQEQLVEAAEEGVAAGEGEL
jgi:hypothetical protein